ncbi:MAG: hypothetical protein RR326_07915, partial [Stenotrophomonas sp.]
MTRMYSAIVDAEIPAEALDARTAWQRLQLLNRTLAAAYPSINEWFGLSRGPEMIPLDDEGR